LNEEPTKPHKVKPGVIRAGGKSRLVDRLLPYVPKKGEHDCYCEPFAGGLALLLAKERSPVEVLNDIDGDLVTFYRCVRFHPEPLCAELEFVLNSRQEFMDFKRQPGLTDIQQAARWFFRNKVSFGGGMDSFGVACSSGGGAASSRESRMEDIRRLSGRLDRTIIENVSWEKCLELYDRPRTFFFCDPPYTACGKTAYAAWKESDVMKFREALRKVRGNWMVTLNDCESNRSIFDGCHIESVERALGIAGKAGSGRTYREIIIRPRR
jgi:DNA adenine methylase